MSAPSWADYYLLGRAEAVLRRPDLSYNEGDVTDMMTAGAGAMADRLTGYLIDRFRATYLDGASGDDLTQLASDHWNVQRRDAVAATGQVTFSRATYANGAGSLDAGFIVATAKDSQGRDVQYATDADAVFGATTLTVTVQATAVVAGAGGRASAGTVVKTITTPFDSAITVTNGDKMAGGADAESDPDLRERVRRVPSTLRRGTIDALEYGALQVSSVKSAEAVEDGTGITNVYVADVDGNSNDTMVDAVAAELENWRAAGSLVQVAGGELYDGVNTNGAGRLIVDVTVTTRANSGVDVAALASNVKAAIVAKVAKLGIGQTMYRTMVKQAAMNVDPANIVEVEVNVPALDIVPSASQIVRTTSADVTVS
jgi:hypothetical protein